MLLLQGERYAVFLRVDFALDQQDVHLETTSQKTLPTPHTAPPRSAVHWGTSSVRWIFQYCSFSSRRFRSVDAISMSPKDVGH